MNKKAKEELEELEALEEIKNAGGFIKINGENWALNIPIIEQCSCQKPQRKSKGGAKTSAKGDKEDG